MAKIKLKFESTLKKLKFDEAKLSKQIKSNIEEIRKATDGIDDADVDMDMVNKDDEELVDAIEKYVNIDYPKVQKMVEGRANKKAASQTPPAAPATGVTVYPTFFFGTDAYGQVVLDDVEYNYLSSADKSDPMNQTRVVSWKMMYGTIILNNAYMARTESGSAFSATYSAGTAAE